MPWLKIGDLKAKRQALQSQGKSSMSGRGSAIPVAQSVSLIPPADTARPARKEEAAAEAVTAGATLTAKTVKTIPLPFDRHDFSRHDRGISIESVSVPTGRCLMGSPVTRHGEISQESPQHWVTIQAFQMAKYPVTQAQWRVIAACPEVERSLVPEPSHFHGEQLPVENISWWDAREFCLRLSRLTGQCYRLPTEAEWEYACRARTLGLFSWGQRWTTDFANCRDAVAIGEGKMLGVMTDGTTPVGQFPANAFGLCDMHGNVWEWCADNWHDTYEGAPGDGRVWLGDVSEAIATAKVLRGGSWADGLQSCRSAARASAPASTRLRQIGLRVVCDG